MEWTVLQPNLFLDKLPIAVVGGPVLAGQPVTLVGEGRRKTLLIGGPHAVSWRDVVADFEQELGREVPVRTVPLGQPVPGLPDIAGELLTALETYDSPLDMTTLATAYQITLTTLADFVRSFLAAHRQASATAASE